MFEVDISSVLARASLAGANGSKGDGGDDGGEVSASVAPVEGLEVEAVLLLVGPGELVFVHHGSCATVA